MKSFLRARQTSLICLALALATVIVYWRVGGFDFVNYDDVYVFFGNSMVRAGLTWKSITWGATTFYYEYWHPLMWWSHELDCQLFGLNAGPHHLVSLGFHITNTLLVFGVFRRMTGMIWRSAVVAALFALHPLHVESVAWLAERKDLLSTFFWLLSIWAYTRYVEVGAPVSDPAGGGGASSPSPREERAGRGSGRGASSLPQFSKLFYGLSLLFFLLGLLSKPMVVTLPFVLLLLDYWPLNRISMFNSNKDKHGLPWSRLIREKLPFFALTVIFCFTTWYSVKAGNNFPISGQLPWGQRLANIPISYARYLGKTIFPSNLAVLYPMPAHWPWWQVAGAVFILLLITWLVLVRARSSRYLVFGWLMFLGTLVPTIGIVTVGAQSIADRYMYLPCIGLFAAAVWLVADLSTHLLRRDAILAGATAAILAIFGSLSWIQVQYWRDSVSLWTHCLATGADGAIAHHDLGRALIALGRPDKAMEQYQAALKLDPNDRLANLSYGGALVAVGKPREATNYFAIVLKSNPDFGEAHENMGLALIDLGDLDGAILHFGEAIRLNPTRATAYTDMGRALSAKGETNEAVKYYSKALDFDPAYSPAYYFLGMEYLRSGSIPKAVSSLEKAVQFEPATIGPHLQLAQIYSSLRETGKAIAQYRAIVRLKPDELGVLNNLAWLLATSPDAQFRNGAEAVQLADRACKLTSYQQTIYVGTLAAAYAESGQFDQAVQTAQKACDLAAAHGETNLLTRNKALLVQYQSHQPYREN